MTTTGNSKPAQAAIDWRRVVSTACLECDWSAIATTALGSRELAAMVGEALRMIGRSIENGIAQTEAQAPPVPVDEPSVEREDSPEVENVDEASSPPADERAMHAASLLGVSIDASVDEIRAALRSRLSASRLHPDHGGDGEQAKMLIAAKNLLVERARAVQP